MGREDSVEIFVIEQRVLETAKEVANNAIGASKDEILNAYQNLTDEYAALLNQVTKLTRLSDGSQRKLIKVQDKLEEQNNELEKLNATKDKFFSIISHDLRNPVTSVMLMSELLNQNLGKLTVEQLESNISKIASSIKVVHELFENLHRWSKTQTGSIEFKQEVIEMDIIAARVLEITKTHAENKKIKLISEIEQNIAIKADPNMIETVIRNLISNSIKFTNADGFVKLVCYKDGDNVHIKIEDNGVGIPEEKLSKLFKIGESISSKGTAKEVGSGLGLILCKEFIEKHNGHIWVDSQIGQGTQFHITIPQATLE